MLIVHGNAAAPVGQLKLDNLVVNVEWPAPTTEPPRYWRTGDFRHSLLEIGVHGQTGQLVSMTLVSVKELSVWPPKGEHLDELATTVVNGIPVFDVTDWQNDTVFVDEPNDLRIKLGTDRVLIEWGRPSAPARSLHSGRILFGVDERGALFSVQIAALSNEDVDTIRNMYTG